MKEIDKIYTPEECEDRIAEIGRNSAGLFARVMNSFEDITREERDGDPLLEAACVAYKRRQELLSDIACGMRSPEGEVHHPG